MAPPATWLSACLSADWLVGPACARWEPALRRRSQDLAQLDSPPRILLAEPDPIDFLAGVATVLGTAHSLILGHPRWAATDWHQAIAATQPTVIWGEPPTVPPPRPPSAAAPPSPETILIPTGGTSGRLRFAVHTPATLTAAVVGFQQFFGGDRLNFCCVLPLHHVSGLMQVLRVWHTGGQLALPGFKALEQGQFPRTDMTGWFLSLVPTQLQRLLQNPATIPWLRQFRAILLGGAPAWAELLDHSRNLGLPLAPTYGMTETAAQIATQLPQDFLAGRSGYTVLPHAQVSLAPLTAGDAAPAGTKDEGIVMIQATSLLRGYVPAAGEVGDRPFRTDDIGWLDAAGKLHLRGRVSDKIITGGENVFPAEVEAAIRATGLVQDVAVLGLGDRQWGEVVTAIYVPRHASIASQQLAAAVAPQLSHYKRPKHWIPCPTLPRNAQGKLNRAALRHLAHAHLATAPTAPENRRNP